MVTDANQSEYLIDSGFQIIASLRLLRSYSIRHARIMQNLNL